MPSSADPLTLQMMLAARQTAAATSHGAIKPARLGGVDRDDLRGSPLDDLDHVVRVPGALVGHDRGVDRARDLRHPRNAVHRLLSVDQVEGFHLADGLDRLAGRLVALVCIDAERDLGPDRRADAPYHLDVASRLDADLDLDGLDALGRDLRGFALASLDLHQADGMGDRHGSRTAPPSSV